MLLVWLIAIRLSFFYAAIFTSMGVFLPYWPVWLEFKGLSPTEIGLVVGASFWPRIVTNLLAPIIADRLGRHRMVMVVLALATLASIGLFDIVSSFWLFMLLSIISGGTWAAILPLGEAIVLDHATRNNLAYGRLRLWGSVAFIVMSVGAGYALEQSGGKIIFATVMATLVLCVLACACMPDPEGPAGDAAAPSLRRLLAVPGLVRMVLASGLIQSSHAVFYGFSALHWRAAGHSETAIGWLWGEGVIAEIILFAWGGALMARFTAVRLIILAGVAASCRWSLQAVTTDLIALILTQALHAASFAACYLATMTFIRDQTPPELKASAQGLYAGLGLAPLFGLITPLGGWLFGMGAPVAFLSMAMLAAAGAALAATLSRHGARRYGDTTAAGARGR